MGECKTTEYLELKVTDCKHCYKCIRNCPVKAIRFSDSQATIMQEECVLCGRCFVSCPQNAKRIHSDLPKVQAYIEGGMEVYASIAPSFAANYAGTDAEGMESALKKLGFAGAGEAALGATLVKQEYDALVESGSQGVIVSTCCHTVNMMVEKHFPSVLPHMAPFVSPMQAHAVCIRQQHPDVKVVFIGPCISKKAEAEQYPDYVDCALTFEELDTWLAQVGLELPAAAGKATGDGRGKARFFPTAGGILRAMEKSNPDYDYIAIDGIENCIAALKDITRGNLTNCFIEMSACRGSCIGGPAMSRETGLVRGTTQVNAYASAKDFEVAPLPAGRMGKQFRFNAKNRMRFGESAIKDVLRKIAKTKPEDELNCGSCGYDTCREKAEAVLEGKANLEMCLPYLMNKAKSFSNTVIEHTPNGIMVLSNDLDIQQINEAARRILNVRHEEDVLERNVACLMEPDLFREVLQGGCEVHDRRLYLADYGRHITITVIQDRDYGLLICIMRDVTETEAAREARRELADQTIKVTDDVIDRQMRTVQEIASLLGETAAETKIALTKLKETLRHD